LVDIGRIRLSVILSSSGDGMDRTVMASKCLFDFGTLGGLNPRKWVDFWGFSPMLRQILIFQSKSAGPIKLDSFGHFPSK
jgi:hypothetical protein